MATAVAVVLALGACGSTPPAAVTAPVAAPPSAAPAPTRATGGSAVQLFERQQRERAEQAQKQGRLADAALAWEVLTVLKPQHAGYRERLAATRTQLRSALDDRLAKAAAAHKRGELDAAAQHYLAALALEPTHDGAADALRAIERERQKRLQPGRLARDLMRRPNGVEADPRVHSTATRLPARPASGPAAGPKAVRPAVPASAAR